MVVYYGRTLWSYIMVIYSGCIYIFLSYACTFTGLIVDLGCSLGLPSQQQLEEENETSSSNVWYRAFESRLDLCLLAKVMLLFGGVIACAFYDPIFNFDHESQRGISAVQTLKPDGWCNVLFVKFVYRSLSCQKGRERQFDLFHCYILISAGP